MNVAFCRFLSAELTLMMIKKKGVQNPLNTLIVYLLFVLFNQTKL